MMNDTNTYDLISKFLAGEARPEEAMDLEDWMRQSDENLRYFEQCNHVFAILETTKLTLAAKNNKLSAWQTITDGINRQQVFPIARAWQKGWIAAASVVLIIVIGLSINTAISNRSGEIVYMPGDEPTNIKLTDGTIVALERGAGLNLDKNFNNGTRSLKFSGSGTFTVRHDDNQQFIIDMRPLYIMDLGTEFTIRSSVNGDTIEIRVTEGKLKLYDDFGWEANVEAGEARSYIKSEKKPVPNEKRIIKEDTVIKRANTRFIDSNKTIRSRQLPDALSTPEPDTIKPWIKPSLKPENLSKKPIPENNGKKNH